MNKDIPITGFRFLLNTVLVVANKRGDASLDLFTLPESQGDTGLIRGHAPEFSVKVGTLYSPGKVAVPMHETFATYKGSLNY